MEKSITNPLQEKEEKKECGNYFKSFYKNKKKNQEEKEEEKEGRQEKKWSDYIKKRKIIYSKELGAYILLPDLSKKKEELKNLQGKNFKFKYAIRGGMTCRDSEKKYDLKYLHLLDNYSSNNLSRHKKELIKKEGWGMISSSKQTFTDGKLRDGNSSVLFHPGLKKSPIYLFKEYNLSKERNEFEVGCLLYSTIDASSWCFGKIFCNKFFPDVKFKKIDESGLVFKDKEYHDMERGERTKWILYGMKRLKKALGNEYDKIILGPEPDCDDDDFFGSKLKISEIDELKGKKLKSYTGRIEY